MILKFIETFHLMHNPVLEISNIEDFCKLNDDVFNVQLRLADDSCFNFQAGQYLLLVLNDDDKRPFSIASAPSLLPNIELQIRDLPSNDFTQEVLELLAKETSIKLEGPFGQCILPEVVSRSITFIVGGTGFAPAKSMLEQLLPQNPDIEIHLYRGARADLELYLSELPQQWQQQFNNFHYHPVISEPSPQWSGLTGLVHKVAMQHLPALSQQEFYVAGSAEMVLATYRDLLDAGVDKHNIHADMLDILREQGELD